MSRLAFDHIGIVVSDISDGAAQLTQLLTKLQWTVRTDDEGLGVSVQFARDSAGLVYELIAPLGDRSPVSRALKARTDLLNHIAYRTKSLDEAVANLRGHRAMPVG